MKKLSMLLLGLILTTSVWAGDFSITSSAFKDNDKAPTMYTCEGDNISPPLSWDHAPANTKSFALVFSSLAWIDKEVFLWILYNIPKETKGFNQDIDVLPGETQSIYNFYDQKTYRGPCPPNEREHKYTFTIYALDVVLGPQDEEMEPQKFIHLIKPHILKQASISILFRH